MARTASEIAGVIATATRVLRNRLRMSGTALYVLEGFVAHVVLEDGRYNWSVSPVGEGARPIASGSTEVDDVACAIAAIRLFDAAEPDAR